MSAQQTSQFSFVRSLLHQLRTYGLNPHDWQIDRSSWNATTSAFALRHRQDADFKFKVQYSRTGANRPRLEKLSLLSL